jgi:predicted 3-demethylubiquinone-9 3-methyltransferase (glyoxalase superfamily)
MEKLMSDPNPEKARRVMEAMLKMKRLDIRQLQAAYDRA